MGSERVLFVAPHPDDVEIGCGATICAFVQASFEVVCVFLTRGEGGGNPDVREKESRKACASLGVHKGNIFFGSFPDTGITDSHEVIAFLERFVDDRLWGVFVPSVHETHQDDRHAGEACHSAYPGCTKILTWETATVDHKIPWSHGGRTDISNAQLMCKQHNSMKKDKEFSKCCLSG